MRHVTHIQARAAAGLDRFFVLAFPSLQADTLLLSFSLCAMKIQLLSLTALAGSSVAINIPVQRSARSTLYRRSGGTSVSVSNPSSKLIQPQVLAASSTTNSTLSLRLLPPSRFKTALLNMSRSDVQDLIYIANVSLERICSRYSFQLNSQVTIGGVRKLNRPLNHPNHKRRCRISCTT